MPISHTLSYPDDRMDKSPPLHGRRVPVASLVREREGRISILGLLPLSQGRSGPRSRHTLAAGPNVDITLVTGDVRPFFALPNFSFSEK